MKDRRPEAFTAGNATRRNTGSGRTTPPGRPASPVTAGAGPMWVRPPPPTTRSEKNPFFFPGPPAPAAPAAQDSLRLELFIMSYCPYGVSALQELLPIARKWKGRLDLKIY